MALTVSKRAGPSYRIVASAENRPYQAWQTLLLHHSCVTHQRQAPIIVVHGDSEPLDPLFERLIERGGLVQRAPNYRHLNGIEYAARNTPATLLHARADTDFLVLCDPDMLLLSPWTFDDVAHSGHQVTLDEVSYLRADESALPTLRPACRRAGVPIQTMRESQALGGVPHIVPIAHQEAFARDWLACVACFEPAAAPTGEAGRKVLDWHTNASMWGVLMAAHRLGLKATRTELAQHTYLGHRVRNPWAIPERPWLHYCYPNRDFDKRWFETPRGRRGTVWKAHRARPGTINARLFAAIAAAAAYYGL